MYSTRASFWLLQINSMYLFHEHLLEFYHGPGTSHTHQLTVKASKPIMIFLIKFYVFVLIILSIHKILMTLYI